MSESQLAGPDFGTLQKTLGVYLLGVVLSIVLTLIPFSVVMYHYGTHVAIISVVFVCAILQFLVQVLCFLRLNGSTPQSRTNVWAFVFTIIVAAVVIGGSLWIMVSLNYNMMH